MKLSTLSLSLVLAALVGCGGSQDFFDAFEPRTAQPEDYSAKGFDFDWLPEGNPFGSSVGTMRLEFGAADQAGTATFRLQETDGATATGEASLSGSTMTFEVATSSGPIDLAPGDTVGLKLEADVADGRIRLTDTSRMVEATSTL